MTQDGPGDRSGGASRAAPEYQLEALLATGRHGQLWRARHPNGAEVALRRVPAAEEWRPAGRMRREAEALASLDHPHIVALLDVFEDDDGIGVVTEHAPGGTLADRLADGPLAPEQVVVIAAQLASALEAAHRRGIIHGAVKPAHVLFASDGRALLGSFGLAGAAGGHAGQTPHHRAPEVVAGHPPTERSDVYSLAVLCYEAITGAHPFDPDGAAPHETSALVTRVRTLAPWVDPGLAAVIERAISREPARRPPHAAKLASELRCAIVEAGGSNDEPAGPEGWPAAVLSTRLAEPSPRAGGVPAVEPGHRSAGAAPPPEPRRDRRRVRHRTVAIVGAMTLLGPAVALLVPGPWRQPAPEQPAPGGGTESVAPPDDREVPAAGGGARCSPSPLPPGARDATHWADLDGDGCLDPLRWDGGTLEIPAPAGPRRFSAGQPGDMPLVADWNCDGRATLALYRPAEGLVFTFSAWPEHGHHARSAPATTGHPRNGAPRIATSPETGCAVVDVGVPGDD